MAEFWKVAGGGKGGIQAFRPSSVRARDVQGEGEGGPSVS